MGQQQYYSFCAKMMMEHLSPERVIALTNITQESCREVTDPGTDSPDPDSSCVSVRFLFVAKVYFETTIYKDSRNKGA